MHVVLMIRFSYLFMRSNVIIFCFILASSSVLNFNYALSLLLEYAAFVKLRFTRKDGEFAVLKEHLLLASVIFFLPR